MQIYVAQRLPLLCACARAHLCIRLGPFMGSPGGLLGPTFGSVNGVFLGRETHLTKARFEHSKLPFEPSMSPLLALPGVQLGGLMGPMFRSVSGVFLGRGPHFTKVSFEHSKLPFEGSMSPFWPFQGPVWRSNGPNVWVCEWDFP